MKQVAVSIALGSVLLATTAHARCKPGDISLTFPLKGEPNKVWVIQNFMDLDPGPGLRDFKGNTGKNAKTYNGHNAIDIDTSTFREMDAGTNIFAAAAGKVTAVVNHLFDRNYSFPAGCGEWNHVALEHANGWVTWYGHMRQGNTRVKVGDTVYQGQPIGTVGSSGCSTMAHLHFEVHCDNVPIDPYRDGLFVDAPSYDPPLKLMDMSVRKGTFPRVDTNLMLVKDPVENITSVHPGTIIAVALSTAGGRVGEHFAIQLMRPDGSLEHTIKDTLKKEWRHAWPNYSIKIPNVASGTWFIRALINGNVVRTHPLTIEPNPFAIVQAVHSSTYVAEFQSLVESGYRPQHVDGSSSPDGARMSAIFTLSGTGTPMFHDIDGNAFDKLYRDQTAAGNQLMNVDAYVRDGVLNLAGHFGPKFYGRMHVERLLTRDVHQQVFNDKTRAGYVPMVISVAVFQGIHFYTSVYVEKKTAGMAANQGIVEATLRNLIRDNAKYGMGLAYLDVYDNGAGVPLFSTIWTKEVDPAKQEVHIGLKEGRFNKIADALRPAGHQPVRIVSYLVKGQRTFAGIFQKK